MDAIDKIRAFNRSYTARMGLLSRHYLGSDMNLTEMRVLYELAHHSDLTARALSEQLDVDEGYLSRVLKTFDAKGWITRTPSPADARQRVLNITPGGQAAFDPLVRKSRADIAERVAHCTSQDLAIATDALATAEKALSGAGHPVVLRDLQTGDAGWLIQQHAELYARDEGFDETFEPLVAEILADFIRSRDPACERAWIAARGDTRLGSIFCVKLDDQTAKLRLFLLVPQARGLGLGKRLLNTCIAFAREKGYANLQLWTHESHRAACALYAANGFDLVDSKPVRSFGVDLVEQTWVMTL